MLPVGSKTISVRFLRTPRRRYVAKLPFFEYEPCATASSPQAGKSCESCTTRVAFLIFHVRETFLRSELTFDSHNRT